MGNQAGKSFGREAEAVILKDVNQSAISSLPSEVATFAAGCFWGVELSFQRVPGVIKTEVGYTQGRKPNPTYEEVCSGMTGHVEAVQVTFFPDIISYNELLVVYWDRFDPTTLNRQGGDTGTQYRSGIYYHNENQRLLAAKSKDIQQRNYQDLIVTEILPATAWYPAESYHQQYLAKGGQCSFKGDTTPIRCYG